MPLREEPAPRPQLVVQQVTGRTAKAPPPLVGDPPAWDPVTSTLIFGARDAVLVDALITVREALPAGGRNGSPRSTSWRRSIPLP